MLGSVFKLRELFMLDQPMMAIRQLKGFRAPFDDSTKSVRGAATGRDNSGSIPRMNNLSPLTKEALVLYLSIHKLEK